MSNYVKCRTCGHWGFADKHACPPIWEARIFETKWQNDWTEVYATDAEDAAERFAEEYDQGGDYTIIRDGNAEIEVRRQGSDEAAIFDISAESVPEYTAHARI